jgi:hypothetical protein
LVGENWKSLGAQKVNLWLILVNMVNIGKLEILLANEISMDFDEISMGC